MKPGRTRKRPHETTEGVKQFNEDISEAAKDVEEFINDKVQYLVSKTGRTEAEMRSYLMLTNQQRVTKRESLSTWNGFVRADG